MEISSAAPRLPIAVESIRVQTGRLVVTVVIDRENHRDTTAKLAAYVLALKPDLGLHPCVNDEGSTFGAVIENTSTAHMLEHLYIDAALAHAVSDSQAFTGTTAWVSKDQGKAELQLSYVDDLDGLRAFNEALNFLNQAVLICMP